MPNIISTMRNSRYQTRRSAKQMEFEQKQAISRDGRGPKPVWSDITGAEFLPPGFEYFVSQAPAPASAQAQSTAVLIPESSIFQPAVTAAASMSADAAESLAIRLENFDSFSITTDHRSSSPESFTLVGSGATTPEQYYYSAAGKSHPSIPHS